MTPFLPNAGRSLPAHPSRRNFFLVPAMLFMLLHTPAWAQHSASVTWLPDYLTNGSPCIFTVRAPGARTVTGVWQKHPLEFFRSGNDHETWYALAGVDVGVEPGTYPIEINIGSISGPQSIQRSITIASAPYTEVALSVPEKFVEPSPKAQKVIEADQRLKRRVFSHSAAAPLWTVSFSPPLPSAPSTDSFGTRRVFNGSLASIHRGLDYHARPGTPVHAANSGRVILARSLYFEGNCVAIDHGLGMITIYMHLSKFKVKEGQRITRHQLVGLSGRTGRANGPHLHFSVRWQGDYLDPAQLLSLKLPTPAS